MAHDSPGRALTTGSIRRHLLRLTLPMTWGILAVISNTVVDTYFVSRLGTDALSALSFTFPVALTIASLAIGLGAGAASVVSRTIGGGDLRTVQRRATDALVLSLLLVALTVAIGLLTIGPLFSLLGAEGPVLALIREYMTIWYCGMPFVVVPMVGNSLIRAAGDARVPGTIMVLAAVVNATLDPLLIFGLLGFPALGVAGAAWATLVANAAALVAALLVLQFREHLLAWRLPRLSAMLESWRAVLHVGIPAAVANMINPLGIGVITALLARFGKEAVAAFGLATRIEALSAVGLLALSATIGPIVGQNLGAKLPDRVWRALRRAFQFSVIYGLSVAVFITGGAHWITQAFTDSPEVANLARTYLWIVPLTIFGYGINIVGAAALNAAAKPLYAAMLTFVRMALIYIPAALLLSRLFDAVGVFIAAGLANLGAAVITVVVARRKLSGDATGVGRQRVATPPPPPG